MAHEQKNSKSTESKGEEMKSLSGDDFGFHGIFGDFYLMSSSLSEESVGVFLEAIVVLCVFWFQIVSASHCEKNSINSRTLHRNRGLF